MGHGHGTEGRDSGAALDVTGSVGSSSTTIRRPRAVILVSVLGIVGVLSYVGAWLLAGMLTPGYDPLRQAISETFAVGSPPLPAGLVRASLIGSGIGLAAFGWALDHGLPGHGRAAPLTCTLSGALTVLVAVFPCTRGCPGVGTTLTDTLHVFVAGGGYLALMLTPMLTAWRVRAFLPVFARWSLVLGGLALAGFLVRNLGADAMAGLQQRLFNTVADAWYVVAGVVLIRRARSLDRRRDPDAGPSHLA